VEEAIRSVIRNDAVSTLLEILPYTWQTGDVIVVVTPFQPFLRFYRFWYCCGTATAETAMFQPFLRFYR